MAVETPLTFVIGADRTIRMDTHLGDITGMTFRARIADSRTNYRTRIISESAAAVTIFDAASGIVDWTIEDSDWPADQQPGPHYKWDLWRDDAGDDVALGFGTATLMLLPGSR